MTKPELQLIKNSDETMGSSEVAQYIADIVIENMGVGPKSPYVTHHDVRRAAIAAVQEALDFYYNNPPIEGVK